MAKIFSYAEGENYKVEIKSTSGNVVISDEPEHLGGKDLGFSPDELLAASLGACSTITVKMYAERKNWDVRDIQVQVDLEFLPSENKTVIRRTLTWAGSLDETQIKRLLAVANACPIHKILSNPIEIHTKTV